MENRESTVNQKRKEWRKEIRKKEIDQLFSKKRRELVYLATSHQQEMPDDECTLQAIRRLISTFSFSKAVEALKIVVRLDSSLSLFFQISGVVPEKVPQIFAQILKQATQQVPKCINYHKYWDHADWLHRNTSMIVNLYNLLEEWQAQNKGVLTQIISKIHSLKDFNSILEIGIVHFFTFVSNILVAGCWADTILNQGNQYYNQSESKRGRQLQSCTFILTNILAGPDEVILPFCEEILYANGGNVRFIGLFFNMFLVKGTSERTKIDMLKILARVLNFNSDVFLDDHKEIVYIIRIGLSQFDSSPDLEEQFVGVGQKLIFMLGEILKVLNLRYDNSGLYLKAEKTNDELQDLQFIYNLSAIFQKLSSNVFLTRLILESNPIKTLVLNSLRLSSHPFQLKTIINYLEILSKSTQDHLSLYHFQNQPRLLKRIISNIEFISRIDLNEVLLEHYQIVSDSFFVLGNCCADRVLFQKMLENGLLELIACFYFRVQKASRVPKSLRDECQYLFLNLLINLKKEIAEQHQEWLQVLSCIFGREENIVIFKQLLYHKNQTIIIDKALSLLVFFITIADKYTPAQSIQLLLRRQEVLDQLREITQSHSSLAQKAERVLILLRRRQSSAISEEQSQMLL